MKNRSLLWILTLLSAALMSLPWLVPHTGALALVGFVPLLVAEEIASRLRVRHFWILYSSAFVLWNAATTFWVCNATVGGGIFAILANALQMSLIFGIFRFSRKRLAGVLPYLLLAFLWIAWERWYLCSAQISWPWLVLGNAFADTTSLVQWYEWTGTLGGSLWVWACNLGVYALTGALSELAAVRSWTPAARIASLLGLTLVVAGPIVCSRVLYDSRGASLAPGRSAEGSVDVLIAQPNFDPYQKFESMSRAEQNEVLLDLCAPARRPGADTLRQTLILAPETFTSDVILSPAGPVSPTLEVFRGFLSSCPARTSMLMGASTYEIYDTPASPSILARRYGKGWIRSHNSALMFGACGPVEVFHKSKLVVGTELTPYPKLFVPLDNWLSAKMGVGGLLARCEGQNGISLLHLRDGTPVGCAVCYESVYGEYCAGYVREGAQMLSVITNDAWWGNAPGYRQHFNYSRLRAIELRRDIARCGNTGISAVIDCRGDVVQRGPWWERTALQSSVKLHSAQTLFVRYGDIVGRVSVLCACLLLALLLLRCFVRK